MSILKFKCTLLSDVILNQKAATEGPNQTLDFIPGSCFLGIVASKYYPEEIRVSEDSEKKLMMDLFHSGKVRFGDAHPSKDGVRGLKVPAAMFHPKLSKASEVLYYIHHATNHDDSKIKEKQLKQCRSGYYNFSEVKAKPIETETNFAIKSAYDGEKRRSKDERMYGYQSLQKGLELYFEVVVDNNELDSLIVEALEGKKRVGRSRTAQYGLVEIEKFDYKEIDSSAKTDENVEVYADGRLIFLDDNGLPTFRPKAKDLGLEGEICWEKSQIRTFQYAPWNFKRQCFDTDRCGIEKGSVFVVKAAVCPDKSQYVGFYQNEGFGKVIYNPAFLKAEADGVAKYRLQEPSKKGDDEKENEVSSDSELFNYLMQQKKREELEGKVYKKVNEWVDEYNERFKGELFASQWGGIRSIATKEKTLSEIKNELFEKIKTIERKDKDENIKKVDVPYAYLTHGTAADKWKERGRFFLFKTFVDEVEKEVKEYDGCFVDEYVRLAIINLAAEMAKVCRKEGK